MKKITLILSIVLLLSCNRNDKYENQQKFLHYRIRLTEIQIKQVTLKNLKEEYYSQGKYDSVLSCDKQLSKLFTEWVLLNDSSKNLKFSK